MGEFVGFWEETINLGSPKCSPLETKGFTPTAIFKFARNISRMIRIASNTGVPVKGPYVHYCCKEPVRGRVQQKIPCFMWNDCSRTERL